MLELLAPIMTDCARPRPKGLKKTQVARGCQGLCAGNKELRGGADGGFLFEKENAAMLLEGHSLAKSLRFPGPREAFR